MKLPKISVIVPVYNAALFLDKCVASILSQSFKDFELLLIDDGSRDESGTLCEEYAQKDARVKVYHKENGGVSSARNLGIDKASGIWITFVDSDDWLETDFLKILMSHNNTSWVVGGFKRFGDKKDEIIPNKTTIYNVTNDTSTLWKATLKEFIFWYVWGKLYRLDIIRENNISFLNDMKYSEDNCFVLEYMSHIETFSYIAYSGYCHLYEKGRAEKYRMTFNEFECHINLQDKCFKLLEEKTQNPFVEVRNNIYRRFFYSFLSNLLAYNDYHMFCDQRTAFLKFNKERQYLCNLTVARRYKLFFRIPPYVGYIIKKNILQYLNRNF